MMAVFLMLSAAAEVAGSRWLILYGFPGLSEGGVPEDRRLADGSSLTTVCLVRDSVPWLQLW